MIMLLLSVSCVATAQTFKEGSVRLKGGQEQPGLIGELRPGSPEGIEYKATSSDGEVQIFYANEIEGYTVDKIFFTGYHNNKYRDNDWTFVELLAEGKLTLIRRNNMYFLRQSGNGEFTHLTGRYKTLLARMTRDCPLVSAKAGRVRLERAELTEFIKNYNDCIPASGEANLEGMPRVFSVGFQLGYDYTMGTFQDNAATRFLSANNQVDKSYFQGGVEVNFKSYKFSKHVGFYTGALVNFDSYSGTNRSLQDAKHPEVNQYSLKISELKIPFGIDISRPREGNLSFHVRGGVMMPLVMSFQSTHPFHEVSDANGSTITYGPTSRITSYRPSIMVGGGFGFDYRISKSYVRLQAGFYQGSVTTSNVLGKDQSKTSGKLQSFNVSTTYIF